MLMEDKDKRRSPLERMESAMVEMDRTLATIKFEGYALLDAALSIEAQGKTEDALECLRGAVAAWAKAAS